MYGLLTSLKAKEEGAELHFQPQWHLVPPLFGGSDASSLSELIPVRIILEKVNRY